MDILNRDGKVILRLGERESRGSLDLSGRKLNGAVFDGLTLEGAFFAQARLHNASFVKCDLYWANFFEATAVKADFRAHNCAVSVSRRLISSRLALTKPT